MIRYVPTNGVDFIFTHNNTEYAMGYEEFDDAYCLTQKSQGTWQRILVIESGVGNDVDNAKEFMVMALEEVNKKVFGSVEPPKNEFEKLLQITSTGLQYTPTGIVRK